MYIHACSYAYLYAFVCFMSQSPIATIDEAITSIVIYPYFNGTMHVL